MIAAATAWTDNSEATAVGQGEGLELLSAKNWWLLFPPKKLLRVLGVVGHAHVELYGAITAVGVRLARHVIRCKLMDMDGHERQ